jgi:hypothetical protein
VPPARIAQIRGFADQKLRNPKDPFDAANRRVSVLVQYREPQELAAPKQADAQKPAPPPGNSTGH